MCWIEFCRGGRPVNLPMTQRTKRSLTQLEETVPWFSWMVLLTATSHAVISVHLTATSLQQISLFSDVNQRRIIHNIKFTKLNQHNIFGGLSLFNGPYSLPMTMKSLCAQQPFLRKPGSASPKNLQCTTWLSAWLSVLSRCFQGKARRDPDVQGEQPTLVA